MALLFLLLTIIGCKMLAVAGYPEPKSEIRFGWGMLFDYQGQVLHGLNRYHLMVGIEIPNLKLSDYYTPTETDNNFCEQFDHASMQTLYITCKNVWPAYTRCISEMKGYQRQVNHIVNKQLPAILPNFKPQQDVQNVDTVPLPGTNIRKKRFISELISLGIQGVSAFMAHHKQNKLMKGMKHLMHKQNLLNTKIVALEDDMMSLSTATLSEIEFLKSELQSTGMYIKSLTKQIKGLEIEKWTKDCR